MQDNLLRYHPILAESAYDRDRRTIYMTSYRHNTSSVLGETWEEHMT